MDVTNTCGDVTAAKIRFCPEPDPCWAAFIDSSIGGISPRCVNVAGTKFLIHHLKPLTVKLIVVSCLVVDSVAQVATSVPRPMDRTPIQSQVCSSPAGPSGLSGPAQCK